MHKQNEQGWQSPDDLWPPVKPHQTMVTFFGKNFYPHLGREILASPKSPEDAAVAEMLIEGRLEMTELIIAILQNGIPEIQMAVCSDMKRLMSDINSQESTVAHIDPAAIVNAINTYNRQKWGAVEDLMAIANYTIASFFEETTLDEAAYETLVIMGQVPQNATKRRRAIKSLAKIIDQNLRDLHQDIIYQSVEPAFLD